jgi:Flavoprotein
MSEPVANARGVLYIISCAASSATLVPNLVTQAQGAGWEVCVITTPQGTRFLDIPLLEKLTGYPVRSEYKRPEEPDVLPRADALVVFPATFNTTNKWVLGVSDTLALGLLCECTGLKMPIVTVPCFRTGGGLDGHPAFFRSLRMLREYGVRVLYEPETYPPKNQVPPQVILEVLDETIQEHVQRRNKTEMERY